MFPSASVDHGRYAISNISRAISSASRFFSRRALLSFALAGVNGGLSKNMRAYHMAGHVMWQREMISNTFSKSRGGRE